MTPGDPSVSRSPAAEVSGAEIGRLVYLLAENFYEPVTCRRIVHDALGIEVIVGSDPDARNFWWPILNRVPDRAGMERLLDAARQELPDNRKLAEALEAIRRGATSDGETVVEHQAVAEAAVTLHRLALTPRYRLVDRTDAVAVLRDELTRAVGAHSAQQVLLIGESGVGKTRLAEECMLIADELCMAVVHAECVDAHAEPLLPLRSGFALYRQDTPVRDLLHAGRESLADYQPFLESFLGIMGPTAAPPPLGGSSAWGVYEGLAQVLSGLAEPAGLCLVVDDLTDADEDTLLFLEYLGRTTTTNRLVTVSTVREDQFQLQPALGDRVDKWRAAGCVAIPVQPFSPPDAAEFITVLGDGKPLPAAVVDEVVTLTGCYPFFIEQVMSSLAQYAEEEHGLADVPDRVEAALKRRLRPLSDETRAALDAAAVALDVTNLIQLVGHVAEVDVGTITSRLVVAVKQRFLVQDAEGDVRFAQKLLQQVLLKELLPYERTRLDVRAAEWLEGEQLFASACHHYERAGRTADMLRTALLGAERAEHAGTYGAAVQLYLRARPAGDPIDIDLRLARDYLILGAWPDAEAVLAGLPANLGPARVLRSELYFVRGNFDRALRELRLAAQGPAVNRTDALIRLADIHLYLGRLRESIRLATDALRASTDPTDRSRCLAGIGTCRYHLGDVEGAEREYLESMAALPTDIDKRDRFAYTVALHNFGLAREAYDDWAGALRHHGEALRLRLDVSAAREVGHSRHSIVRCKVALGDYDAARELLTEARAAAIALGEELEQGKLDHTEAKIELLTGRDPEFAISLIERARERFSDLHVGYDIAHASFSLASALSGTGAARRALEEAASARVLLERGDFGLLGSLYPDLAYRYADRVAAGLLGYAAGDAVGLPWERMPPDEIDHERLPWLHATAEWPAGATSDDTALTLLVMEDLAATGAADPAGFLRRLAAVAPSIHGLGPSTRAAVEGYQRDGMLPSGGGNTNGAVMRSLPVGWALPIDCVDERRDWAIALSRATHPGAEAVIAACVGAACAAWAIEGASADMLVEIACEEAAAVVPMLDADPRIQDLLAAVADASWWPDSTTDLMDPYETLTRALWCVAQERTAADAVLAAVHLGGDTDTVAALVGGLIGCRMPSGEVRSSLPWLGDVLLPADDVVQRLSQSIAALRIAHADA